MSEAQVLNGDCLEVMAAMDADSVDSIVCDPPYGISFMGRNWDHGVPGEAFWAEALRVAKPGAYLLAFGGTRTYHRLAVAIEDAGWEIRDCLGWLYGSGFPKSHDISKAIDKAAGAEREVIATVKKKPSASSDCNEGWVRPWAEGKTTMDITAPATDAAKQWEGWGTALKPAWEPIIMARKPLVGTVANNVLTYSTGGINIDASRVGSDVMVNAPAGNVAGGNSYNMSVKGMPTDVAPTVSIGRFPANIIHDGSDEVLELFPQSKSGANPTRRGGLGYHGAGGQTECVAPRGAESGSAARFFYCAKASRKDRDEGLDDFEVKRESDRVKGDGVGGDNPRNRTNRARKNHHPTVKPTSLMEYLVRMVTPEGGVVLDPFMGSGSTLKAASRLGFDCIGIDLSAEYCDIARSRIERSVS